MDMFNIDYDTCLPKVIDGKWKCVMKWTFSGIMLLACVFVIIIIPVLLRKYKNKFAKFETPTGIMSEGIIQKNDG